MVSFYVIRKLLEGGRISTETAGLRVPVVEYERGLRKGRPVEHPLLRVDYDLDHPVAGSSDLLPICHQIVHSYVFSAAVGYDESWAGAYFASDFKHNSVLYFVNASTFVQTLRRVGRDPEAEFSPWVEERLDRHRVQTAFPQPKKRPTPANPSLQRMRPRAQRR